MLETVLGHPKGEGHATKLTFLSLLIASKHSAFPPTVSAHEVPAILKKFVSKEATSESAILKLPWQPGRVTFMWRHSVRLGIRGKEKNLHLTTQGQQNLFFQAIIHFTIFNAKISEFGTCLTQNNMAQGPGCWVLFKMAPTMFRILGFFRDEFHEKNLNFRGWNFGKWLNLVQDFSQRWQKICVF